MASHAGLRVPGMCDRERLAGRRGIILNPAGARDTVAAVVRRAGPPICRKPVRADILGDRLRISMVRATQEATAMTQTPTKTQILLARLAVALIVSFAVLGFAMYGFSAEVRQRLWQNLLDRPSGPMTFRFFLQPIMASIAAWRDGVKDARAGRSPFFWTMVTHPEKLGGRLREGLIATSRIILLGLVMDVIYQFLVFGTFHPGEAGIIAILLAFVPYLVLRGPFARVVAWWRGGRLAGSGR
jgi:hypothetical protein